MTSTEDDDSLEPGEVKTPPRDKTIRALKNELSRAGANWAPSTGTFANSSSIERKENDEKHEIHEMPENKAYGKYQLSQIITRVQSQSYAARTDNVQADDDTESEGLYTESNASESHEELKLPAKTNEPEHVDTSRNCAQHERTEPPVNIDYFVSNRAQLQTFKVMSRSSDKLLEIERWSKTRPSLPFRLVMQTQNQCEILENEGASKHFELKAPQSSSKKTKEKTNHRKKKHEPKSRERKHKNKRERKKKHKKNKKKHNKSDEKKRKHRKKSARYISESDSSKSDVQISTSTLLLERPDKLKQNTYLFQSPCIGKSSVELKVSVLDNSKSAKTKTSIEIEEQKSSPERKEIRVEQSKQTKIKQEKLSPRNCNEVYGPKPPSQFISPVKNENADNKHCRKTNDKHVKDFGKLDSIDNDSKNFASSNGSSARRRSPDNITSSLSSQRHHDTTKRSHNNSKVDIVDFSNERLSTGLRKHENNSSRENCEPIDFVHKRYKKEFINDDLPREEETNQRAGMYQGQNERSSSWEDSSSLPDKAERFDDYREGSEQRSSESTWRRDISRRQDETSLRRSPSSQIDRRERNNEYTNRCNVRKMSYDGYRSRSVEEDRMHGARIHCNYRDRSPINPEIELDPVRNGGRFDKGTYRSRFNDRNRYNSSRNAVKTEYAHDRRAFGEETHQLHYRDNLYNDGRRNNFTRSFRNSEIRRGHRRLDESFDKSKDNTPEWQINEADSVSDWDKESDSNSNGSPKKSQLDASKIKDNAIKESSLKRRSEIFCSTPVKTNESNRNINNTSCEFETLERGVMRIKKERLSKEKESCNDSFKLKDKHVADIIKKEKSDALILHAKDMPEHTVGANKASSQIHSLRYSDKNDTTKNSEHVHGSMDVIFEEFMKCISDDPCNQQQISGSSTESKTSQNDEERLAQIYEKLDNIKTARQITADYTPGKRDIYSTVEEVLLVEQSALHTKLSDTSSEFRTPTKDASALDRDNYQSADTTRIAFKMKVSPQKHPRTPSKIAPIFEQPVQFDNEYHAGENASRSSKDFADFENPIIDVNRSRARSGSRGRSSSSKSDSLSPQRSHRRYSRALRRPFFQRQFSYQRSSSEESISPISRRQIDREQRRRRRSFTPFRSPPSSSNDYRGPRSPPLQSQSRSRSPSFANSRRNSWHSGQSDRDSIEEENSRINIILNGREDGFRRDTDHDYFSRHDPYFDSLYPQPDNAMLGSATFSVYCNEYGEPIYYSDAPNTFANSVLRELPKAEPHILQKGNVMEIVPSNDICTKDGSNNISEIEKGTDLSEERRLSERRDDDSGLEGPSKKRVCFKDFINTNSLSDEEDVQAVEAAVERALARYKNRKVEKELEMERRLEEARIMNPPPPPPEEPCPDNLEQPVLTASRMYFRYNPYTGQVYHTYERRPRVYVTNRPMTGMGEKVATMITSSISKTTGQMLYYPIKMLPYAHSRHYDNTEENITDGQPISTIGTEFHSLKSVQITEDMSDSKGDAQPIPVIDLNSQQMHLGMRAHNARAIDCHSNTLIPINITEYEESNRMHVENYFKENWKHSKKSHNNDELSDESDTSTSESKGSSDESANGDSSDKSSEDSSDVSSHKSEQSENEELTKTSDLLQETESPGNENKLEEQIIEKATELFREDNKHGDILLENQILESKERSDELEMNFLVQSNEVGTNDNSSIEYCTGNEPTESSTTEGELSTNDFTEAAQICLEEMQPAGKCISNDEKPVNVLIEQEICRGTTEEQTQKSEREENTSIAEIKPADSELKMNET